MNDTTMNIDNLEAALGYAEIGLPVFPCRIRDEGNKKAKSPYTNNGFQNASTNAEQINCWWANYPNAIIGMPTGKISGLIVLDIDPRHGGDHSLQELIDKYSPLPETLTAITGGGGTHYYFKYPNRSVRCSNSKIASGVDIKADGGYVIMPPSGHESGKSYFWDGDFDLDTVADMPKWLLDLIDAAGKKPKSSSDSSATELTEGERNDSLASWAGTLRYYGRTDEEIYAALQGTNQVRCKPPLSDSEVWAIAKSVSRYEANQGATNSIDGKNDVDLSAFDPESNKPEKHKLVTISLADVEAKELQWLWPNRLPAGMLSLLAGNPGVGKSYLTMFMCSQITTGRDWPDAENTVPKGSVLIFSDEESLEYAIKPRLEAHEADCSKIFAAEHIQRPDGLSDSFGIKEHIQILKEYLDQLPDCRLIIFDPITAYLGAVKANDNAEVRGALLGLQHLAQQRNITILGINHFSKKAELDTIHRVLGSTGFVAAARAVWGVVLEKPEEEDSENEPARLLSPIKSNYSIRPTTLRYEIIDGKVVFSEGHTQTCIDSLMQKAKKANPNLEAAKAFLTEQLEGKAYVYSKNILDKAQENGISKNLIYKAKIDMKVLDWRDGFASKAKWSLEPKND